MDPQNTPLPPVNQPAEPALPNLPDPMQGPPAPDPISAPSMPSAPVPTPAPQEPLTAVSDDPLTAQAQTAPVQDSKQQAVDRLKNSNNVLITVGSNPSVDELASALGLTFVLDKLGKHATTVFSGDIPHALEFLDPEATFENSVDSLRDFIIALDKEKADKLRYKVDDDVVKIFITPYKTTITEKDLQFSQGDFNVDVIVALGVAKREDLDKAITAHGRILHDATIITVNAGEQTSDLGAIDWVEPSASSIAEMLVSITESFDPGLLDEQISTAYLTGIVAATNRFSNEKTSPKVMTMAAQLMAAGANQQLIASNLRQDGTLSESVRKASEDHAENSEMKVDHETKSSDDGSKKSKKPKSKPKKDLPLPPPDIKKQLEEAEENIKADKSGLSENTEDTKEPASESEPNEQSEKTDDVAVQNDDPKEPEDSQKTKQSSAVSDVKISPNNVDTDMPTLTHNASKKADEPDFGGNLNATMVEAEAKTKASFQPQASSTMPADSGPPPLPTDQTLATGDSTTPDAQDVVEDEAARDDALEEARKAVESAAEAQFDPANNPIQALSAQPLPMVDNPAPTESGQTEPSGDVSTGLPTIDAPTDLPAPAEQALPSLPATDAVTSSPLTDTNLPSSPGDDTNNGVVDATMPPALPSVDLPSLPTAQLTQEPDSTAQSSQAVPSLPAEPDQKEPSPMDDFMAAHTAPSVTPPGQVADSMPNPLQAGDLTPPAVGADVMPPMPPLPSPTGGSGLPPLPPLPGQDSTQPAIEPSVQPGFMQDMPASQNNWSQAADDLAQKQQEASEQRQAKMDQMTEQYHDAVDKNRELQGQPPLHSNDHTGFPPPLPPSS